MNLGDSDLSSWTSAWKAFCVPTVSDYRLKSIIWKWDWASVVLRLLLLHIFSTSSPYEMYPCLLVSSRAKQPWLGFVQKAGEMICINQS